MAKIHLTEKKLKAWAKETRDKSIDRMDDIVRGYGVRGMVPTGIVHMLYRRFPGSRMPTRRKLGRYPEMSLADARDTASAWLLQIRKGIDPSREAAREAQANIELERRRSANSFKIGLEAYYRHKTDEGL